MKTKFFKWKRIKEELIISRSVIRYIKGSFLGQTNVILDRKGELHKEMKNVGNGENEGKCKIIF